MRKTYEYKTLQTWILEPAYEKTIKNLKSRNITQVVLTFSFLPSHSLPLIWGEQRKKTSGTSIADVQGYFRKMLILESLFSSTITLENITTTSAQEEASFRWNCVQCREGCTCQKLQWNSDSFTVEFITMND